MFINYMGNIDCSSHTSAMLYALHRFEMIQAPIHQAAPGQQGDRAQRFLHAHDATLECDTPKGGPVKAT